MAERGAVSAAGPRRKILICALRRAPGGVALTVGGRVDVITVGVAVRACGGVMVGVAVRATLVARPLAGSLRGVLVAMAVIPLVVTVSVVTPVVLAIA